MKRAIHNNGWRTRKARKQDHGRRKKCYPTVRAAQARFSLPIDEAIERAGIFARATAMLRSAFKRGNR